MPFIVARLKKIKACKFQKSTRFLLLAEEEGLEPSDAGIKTQCLNQLGDSPIKLFC